MKTIKIADITLRETNIAQNGTLNFKEKVELVKQLDKLNTDVIELNELSEETADILFYKTVSPLVKNSVLCCPAGLDTEKTARAFAALSPSAKRRINVTVPVSAVQMEYFCGCKPEKVLELISSLVKHACSLCNEVEFSADDAMRSEVDFLCEAVDAAAKAGAKIITVCDAAGTALPEEFSAVIKRISAVESVKGCKIAVKTGNALNMATANIFAAAKAGADEIKTSLYGLSTVTVESAVSAISARGESCMIKTGLDTTQLKRTAAQLKRHSGSASARAALGSEPWQPGDKITLSEKSSPEDLAKAVKALGYELSPEDNAKVYEAFKHIARSKKIGARELDAIVAAEAMQVAQTYRLVSYVINSSNVFSSTANISLEKNGIKTDGLCAGDGPIDAAFKAIEKIAGRHFELDDFQIQSVTEGREAVGEALVRLRQGGMLYAGKGTSTDIIGASIKAYLSALNKIAYEENIK